MPPLPRPETGLTTLLNHAAEPDHPHHAHVGPIYQTATFGFPDYETGVAIEEGRQPGYIYTRLGNPNAAQLARKIANLEGYDLLRAAPGRPPEEIVAGRVFASGMAAVSAALLARLQSGDTLIAQRALYGGTYNLLHDLGPQLGLNVAWVDDPAPENWARALEQFPEARLLYAESPVNPTLQVVDLPALAELAHARGAWLYVDNTFATPYCQRPLSFGADVVLHSTTKYLSGHGVVIGGAVASPHLDFVAGPLQKRLELLGATPGPFDCWLADLGLRTFELRMGRHCANAAQLAAFLAAHPAVAAVHYPGLESHPGSALSRRQMHTPGGEPAFGGMLSFELKGGLRAGAALMDRVRVITLGVSLGNIDSLIQHPASMTHRGVPPAGRRRMGITDGLVRLSVGIENLPDLLWDLEQALAGLPG